MTHADKISWMALWAAKNRCTLDLEGECGFGRECVGISVEGGFPDYEWYDSDYNRADKNGDVWCPADAYHKHPCVAVLGRGEGAESQLYDWLQWFDTNGFKLEVETNKNMGNLHPFELLLGRGTTKRMVKQ